MLIVEVVFKDIFTASNDNFWFGRAHYASGDVNHIFDFFQHLKPMSENHFKEHINYIALSVENKVVFKIKTYKNLNEKILKIFQMKAFF